jgi:hypothetical protein
MNFINISDFNKNLDDIVLAKISIENELINNQQITEKFSISDFINWLNFSKSIFMKNVNDIDVNIPFSIYTTSSNKHYVFYISQDDKYIDDLKNYLIQIDFNLHNLKNVNQYDLYINSKYKPDGDYFIINSLLYTL